MHVMTELVILRSLNQVPAVFQFILIPFSSDVYDVSVRRMAELLEL